MLLLFFLPLLFHLLLHPAVADNTVCISFYPATYLTDGNSGPQTDPPPSPASDPQAPGIQSPTQPSSYDPYTSPSQPQVPSSSLGASSADPYYTPQVPSIPSYTPQPPSDPPQISAAPSIPPTVSYQPAIPADTVSCDTIGEPSWVCEDTQRCAFDQVGDVACCPIGDFCRGIVDYGAGAGVAMGNVGSEGRGRAYSGGMGKKGLITERTLIILLVFLLAI